MLLTFALFLATLGPQQVGDTTIIAGRGQRLQIDAHAGDVTVRAWKRDAVQIVTDEDERSRVEIRSSPTLMSVRAGGRHGVSSVDMEISIPAWMPLRVSGVYGDVTVTGVQSAVSVETVQGDVVVRGGGGSVDLQSVEGSVSLDGANGRLSLNSVNSDVRVSNSRGEVAAESVNGEILLDRVDAASVNASTVNGDVTYEGPIKNGGRYTLSSHNGDLTVALDQSANAAVSVSTFNGEFESSFPVTIRDTRRGKRFSFSLGTGSAQVDLQSFEGTIHLVHPGEHRLKRKD